MILCGCHGFPAQFLTKHDPEFFGQKGEQNVAVTWESNLVKNGIRSSYAVAASDHFFIGLSGNYFFRRNDSTRTRSVLHRSQLYNMRGWGVRPVIGFYTNIRDPGLYWEVFAGAGYQHAFYRIMDTRFHLLVSGTGNTFQAFGGTFLGWRFPIAEIGFDFAYEYNHFKNPLPAFSLYSDRLQDKVVLYYLDSDQNFLSSFYGAVRIKKIRLMMNAGWNTGYTGIFFRMGLKYRLADKKIHNPEIHI